MKEATTTIPTDHNQTSTAPEPSPNELAALVAYLADGGPAGAREKLDELLALEHLIFRGRKGPLDLSEAEVGALKLLHVITDHVSDFSRQKRA